MLETNWPKVCVAVLNRNGRRWLPGCLDSLLRTDYPYLEVLVVDNGSTDGSVEFVREAYPQTSVLALGENLGFTGAYNRVFATSDAEYVVLLNNDTVVPDPAWVQALVTVMETDPSIAAATCKLLYMDHPERINSLGGSAYWWSGSFDIGDGEPDEGQYDAPPIEPFAFCGAAAMLRLSAVREVGGFDEALFAYREDFDLSWRLRLQGYRVVYVPEARVFHAGGGTWGPLSYGKLYLSSRNWLRLMLKNYSARNLLRGLPVYLTFELLVRTPGLMWMNRSPRYALMPLQNAAWNLVRLPDTLRARRDVQRSRRAPDPDILRAMGPAGFEPLGHLRQRARVLRTGKAEKVPS